MAQIFDDACLRVDQRVDDLVPLLRQAIAIDTRVPPGLL